jgi:flagellar basal-body rod protein FlgB
MFNNTGWNVTTSILHKGLDTATLRHQVYSNNLANVNTPGFKRDDVIFEQELRRALHGPQPIPANRTHENHLRFKGEISFLDARPGIFLEKDTFSRNDENNVDIDEEMANLTKNEIMFNAISELTKGSYKSIRDVIRTGGRA